MYRLRFSLFSRIMLWFFLNLLLLTAILLLIFNLNFRFEPRSPFSSGSANRIEAVTRLITSEMDEKSREERDAVLKLYSEAYRVEFFLFDNAGKQLAGKAIALPNEVAAEITRSEFLPPSRGRPSDSVSQLSATNRREVPRGLPPPGRPPSFYLKTTDPSLYWLGARIMVFEPGNPEPVRARLLAASDSYSGYGLFFDPTPWLIVASTVIVVSLLFWLPFVRNLTSTIGQLTRATEQIAEESFDVRVDEKRTDELGRLGKAINHLASRLSGFVHGQKRFLGDISHELRSPLARMQFALSVLEDRVGEENTFYIEDVREEVELMSRLVGELLAYSKAGIKGTEVKLESIPLRALVERVVERETAKENAEIKFEIDENLRVLAQPELLERALANLIRNAVRYAADAGEIKVAAENTDDKVRITIADNGAGVPEIELEKLFDPFYRLESDRSRQTGGAGLGLAIVKSCIEACRGKVFAQNRAPSGFEVVILLKN